MVTGSNDSDESGGRSGVIIVMTNVEYIFIINLRIESES